MNKKAGKDEREEVPAFFAEDPTYRFYSAVSARIREAFERSGKSQRQIAAEIGKLGLPINQGSISKLMDYKAEDGNKRAPTLSMIHVVYFCKVLGLDVADVMDIAGNPLEEHDVLSPGPGHNEKAQTFVFDPSQQEYFGYLLQEPFYCYFYPTISSEHSILRGRLRFFENAPRRRCDASLELEVEQQLDENGQPITKKYTGTMVVSIPQRSCYCILYNLDYGEICMLNFHHRYFLTRHSLQCRLACAITTSAGENRRPTVHRMLITKNELSEEDLKILKPQLRLNTKRIVVPKEAVDALIKDGELQEKVSKLFGEGNQIEPKPYYAFDESQIQSQEIEVMDRIRAISRLREFSEAPCYNKSSSKADDLIFKYLNKISKAN